MYKVGRLVYLAALLAGCLGGSVLKVDISRWLKKIREASGFGLQAIIGGSMFVPGTCTLKIFCGTICNLAYYQSDWHCFSQS